jgi:hypothetical protein
MIKKIIITILTLGVLNCKAYSWPFSHDLSKVKSVEIVYDSLANILPGSEIKYGFVCTYLDSSKKLTKGFLKGELPRREFDVTVIGGKGSRGKLKINNKLSPGDYVELSVKLKDNPSVVSKLLIPLTNISSIKLQAIEPIIKTPGYEVKYITKIVLSNGSKILLDNPSKSEINNLKLNYVSDGCSFNNKKMRISMNIDEIRDNSVLLICSVNRYPFAHDTLKINLDYKAPQKYISLGQSGFFGSNGRSGCDGNSGTNGSDGADGCNGSDGLDGKNGEHGPVLDVFVDAFDDSILNQKLLYVEINREQKLTKFLVNPEGGDFSISSTGGSGGSGGDGGSGGNGGAGGNGKLIVETYTDSTGTHTTTHQERGGDGGYGGHGGNGGYGGTGGDGGIIYLDYTKEAEPYMNVIKTFVSGGSCGFGGFGGSAGMGGSGGSPGGNSGRSGNRGNNGNRGYDGYDGKVIYKLINRNSSPN